MPEVDTDLRCSACNGTEQYAWVHNISPRAEYDDVVLCDSCLSSYGHCQWGDHFSSYVGGVHLTDTGITMTICGDCIEAGPLWCDECERYFSPSASFERGDICPDCRESLNDRCNCPDCREDRGEYDENVDDEWRHVFNYTYLPEPLHMNRMEGTDDNYYMGLELETDSVSVYDVSSSVHDHQPELFCKSDASLYTGVEIVSHPGTLAAWQAGRVIDWSKWDETAMHCRNQADESHAGIHIHVSRTAFERKGRWSASHLWKFMQLHFRNEMAFQNMAGRDHSAYAQWQPTIDRTTIKGDVVRNPLYGERYRVVNTNNTNTVELRYFQADEKQEVILQHIELIHASVEYTRNLTSKMVKDDGLDFAKFRTWVSARPETYPHLRTKVNRMYADGIVAKNRELTKQQTRKIKSELKEQKEALAEKAAWYRLLGLRPPYSADQQYNFIDYPLLSSEADLRAAVRDRDGYMPYLAYRYRTPASLIQAFVGDLSIRYLRGYLRYHPNNSSTWVRTDWNTPIAAVTMLIITVFEEELGLTLSAGDMEYIINRNQYSY